MISHGFSFVDEQFYFITRVRGQKTCIPFLLVKNVRKLLDHGKIQSRISRRQAVFEHRIECKQTFREHFLCVRDRRKLFLKMWTKEIDNDWYGQTLFLSIILGFVWFLVVDIEFSTDCTKVSCFIKFEFIFTRFSDEVCLLLFLCCYQAARCFKLFFYNNSKVRLG